MAKVCLDPGHYAKYNRCPANANYYESEIVWKLTYLQKKYLEMLGVEVVVTRSDANVDMALVDRGQASDGCDLFLSNHTNAVGSQMNESVDYAAIYHLVDDTTTICDDVSKSFAAEIAPVIAEVMGLKQGYRIVTRKNSGDRNGDGILNDNYYGVLHGARLVETPGLILEHSFHTNTTTVNWLLVDANLDKLAKAEAECIASFVLEKEVSLDDVEKKEDASTLYRVQVGAYSKPENANAQLQKVKAAGFDTYLIKVGNLYKIQVGAYSKVENAQAMVAKIKAAGFDAFMTTTGGTAVDLSNVTASTSKPATTPTAPVAPSVSTQKRLTPYGVAREIYLGKGSWGVGNARKQNVTAAGYNYVEVQNIVNQIWAGTYKGSTAEYESVEVSSTQGSKLSDAEINAIADRIARGDFGNGYETRLKNCIAAGYTEEDFKRAQEVVNKRYS